MIHGIGFAEPILAPEMVKSNEKFTSLSGSHLMCQADKNHTTAILHPQPLRVGYSIMISTPNQNLMAPVNCF